jgi:hypothetical protein
MAWLWHGFFFVTFLLLLFFSRFLFPYCPPPKDAAKLLLLKLGTQENFHNRHLTLIF